VNGAHNGALSPIIVNGKIYFLADTGNSSYEPWVSDGTEAGTQRIAQIPDAVPDLNQPTITRAGQYLLLDVATGAAGNELWRIDLNTHAVSQVADIAPGTISGVADPMFGSLGTVALFVASSTGGTPTLWRSDGTAPGTQFLANVRPISSPVYVGPTDAARLIFIGDDGLGTAQVWGSDGTTAVVLSTTNAVLLGSVGGKVYFTAFGGSGPELWSTDGTPAGTRRLTGFASNIDYFEVAGSASQLYVRTRRGSTLDIYRYDTGGPAILRSHTLPLGQAAVPAVFAFAQGRLYFDSQDAVAGREIWTSDGTLGGTHLLRNIAPETRTQSSAPAHFFELGGQLYFTADDGVSGREVWRSDGTPGGTQLVADVNPGATSSDPLTLFGLGGRIYFFAKDGPTADSYKLWSSDGTPGSTVLVSAVIPREALFGGQSPCGTSVVTLGAYAYFTAYDATSGTEVWRTDGTAAGTTRVSDIGSGALSSNPCWLAAYQDRLFFSANEWNTSGTELWSAGGTAGAPTLIADIYPGASDSGPLELLAVNGALYFFAREDMNGRHLWRSDGSAAGTRAISSGLEFDSSLAVAGNKLAFLRTLGSSFSSQLWTSDGTTAGTARVGTVLAFGPLHSSGSHAFFRGFSAQAGRSAPWVTDGTDAGTHLLVETDTPILSPIPFWDFRGVTIFQTPLSSGEAMLWRTNGTTAGTHEIGNIGVASSALYPVTHGVAGHTFFFAADDGGTGVELYAIDNDPPLSSDDAGGSIQAGQALVIDVLSNDIDVDGDVIPSTATLVTQPAGGTASINGAGVITYTANASFSGADQFTYSVADNQGRRSLPATVRVTVTAAPSPAPPSTPTPPNSSGGGGGGGAFGLTGLLGLALALASARRSGKRRAHALVAVESRPGG
jgi:ELWxxDGT repeat protein